MSSIPTTTHSIILDKNTDDVSGISYKEVPIPPLKDSQILIHNEYAGINFIDSYFRKGVYPASLPIALGREGSGKIIAVGDSVKGYKVGEKVVYCGPGAYTEYYSFDTANPAATIGKIPSDVDSKPYAAGLLQGLTAYLMTKYSYDIQKGDFILIHAAAGGTGGVLTQIAKLAGAIVIGTTSSPEKVDKIKELGADYVLCTKEEGVLDKILEITKGAGVAAVFDGVGKATWDLSLESLAPTGYLVSFGNASGVVPPVNILTLAPKCVKIMRPQMFGFFKLPGVKESATKAVIELISSGKLDIIVSKEYPLAEYPQATTDLESGKTTGKLICKV